MSSNPRFSQRQSSEDNGHNRRRNFARSNAVFEPPRAVTCYPKINIPDEDLKMVDVHGINLFDFIQTTLHKNPHDRQFMLSLEEQLINFVRDNNVRALKFGQTSSYNRMIIHRVAAFFGLDHNVDNTASCVVCTKTADTRIPNTPFEVMIFHDVWSDRQPRRFAQSFDYGSGNRRSSRNDISQEALDAIKRAGSLDATHPAFPTVEKVEVPRNHPRQFSVSMFTPLSTQVENGHDDNETGVANVPPTETPQQQQVVDRGSTGTSVESVSRESDETDPRLQMPNQQFVAPSYPAGYPVVAAPIPYNYVMINGNRVVPRTDITSLIQHFGAMNVQQPTPEYENVTPNGQVLPPGYYYRGAFYPANTSNIPYTPGCEEYQNGNKSEADGETEVGADNDEGCNVGSGPPATTVSSFYSSMPNPTIAPFAPGQSFNSSAAFMPQPSMYATMPTMVPPYVPGLANPPPFVPMNYVTGVDPNGTFMPAAPYYMVPPMTSPNTFGYIGPDSSHVNHA